VTLPPAAAAIDSTLVAIDFHNLVAALLSGQHQEAEFLARFLLDAPVNQVQAVAARAMGQLMSDGPKVGGIWRYTMHFTAITCAAVMATQPIRKGR